MNLQRLPDCAEAGKLHGLGWQSWFQRAVLGMAVGLGLPTFQATSGPAWSTMSQQFRHWTQKQSFLNPVSGFRPKWKHLLANLAFHDNIQSGQSPTKRRRLSSLRKASGRSVGWGDHLEAECRRACYFSDPFLLTNLSDLFMLTICQFNFIFLDN